MKIEVKQIKEFGSCSECIKPNRSEKIVVWIQLGKTEFRLCEEHAHELKNKLIDILNMDVFYDN